MRSGTLKVHKLNKYIEQRLLSGLQTTYWLWFEQDENSLLFYQLFLCLNNVIDQTKCVILTHVIYSGFILLKSGEHDVRYIGKLLVVLIMHHK